MKFFQSMLRDESGATAIEYGLIAALVAVAAIAAMSFLGGELSTLFDGVGTKIKDANEAADFSGGTPPSSTGG